MLGRVEADVSSRAKVVPQQPVANKAAKQARAPRSTLLARHPPLPPTARNNNPLIIGNAHRPDGRIIGEFKALYEALSEDEDG